MTAQQLQVIRRRHAVAQSGHWRADEVTVTHDMVGETLLVLRKIGGVYPDAKYRDFAENAHNDVADLLDHIDALTAKLVIARTVLGD